MSFCIFYFFKVSICCLYLYYDCILLQKWATWIHIDSEAEAQTVVWRHSDTGTEQDCRRETSVTGSWRQQVGRVAGGWTLQSSSHILLLAPVASQHQLERSSLEAFQWVLMEKMQLLLQKWFHPNFGPLDYDDDLQAVATSIYSFPREGTKESRNIF